MYKEIKASFILSFIHTQCPHVPTFTQMQGQILFKENTFSIAA